MNLTELPHEIMAVIASELTWKEKYRLGRTCKLLWERVSYIPVNDFYNIDDRQEIGSFFRTTVVHARLTIHIRSLKYASLRSSLASLPYLRIAKVEIADSDITVSFAARLLRCFGRSSVTVIVEKSCFSQFSEAARSMDVCNVSVDLFEKKHERTLPQKRKIAEEDQPRTPSPIRRALVPLYENIHDLKKSWTERCVMPRSDRISLMFWWTAG